MNMMHNTFPLTTRANIAIGTFESSVLAALAGHIAITTQTA